MVRLCLVVVVFLSFAGVLISKMDDEQLTLEVDWCLGKLEEKLAGMDPYSRPGEMPLWCGVLE